MIRLTEYITSPEVPLSLEERDALRSLVRTLTITPSAGTSDHYDLTPSGTVGVLRVNDLQVEIRPRLPVDRVLFLVSYALDPRRWWSEPTSVEPDQHLLEAIVPTFTHHTRSALRRGLLHGYRTVEETHATIRGRIRMADQLRRRPGQHLPVELVRDDFTTDILESQLLLAATEQLLRLPLRNEASRRSLRELREQFGSVTPTPFPRGRIPEPTWTRLNERFRPAVTIARLILQGAALDLTTGNITATGVLLDMAVVFENFVIQALRETLGVSSRAFPQGGRGRRLKLDVENEIPLKPDLSWWIGDQCVFVGDCKYKRAAVEGIPNADLYQLLAYTTALDVDDGFLVYAAGEYPAGTHTVRRAGKRLTIRVLSLAGRPHEVLAEIDVLACEIRQIAQRQAHRFAAA